MQCDCRHFCFVNALILYLDFESMYQFTSKYDYR